MTSNVTIFLYYTSDVLYVLCIYPFLGCNCKILLYASIDTFMPYKTFLR